MRTWSVIIIFLFFGLISSGQSLSSSVSSDSILLGNYFIYEIKVENHDESVDFPSFDEFKVVSGPNSSSSVSIINGEKSSSKTYTWYLEPQDLGQYFIAPISIKLEEEFLETDPIEINVFPNPNGIIENPSQNNMENFFDFQRPDIFQQRTPVKPAVPSKPKRELKKG